MIIATLVAMPTLLAPRYAKRAASRASRLSRRFNDVVAEKGVQDEYHQALSKTFARMPYLVLAASAKAFPFHVEASDAQEASDLAEYLKRNPWAFSYATEAAALFVCAQFYGNPYNSKIWKLALMAGVILITLKRTTRISTTFTVEVASKELTRARSVDSKSNPRLVHC
jgi:hypothetical protein